MLHTFLRYPIIFLFLVTNLYGSSLELSELLKEVNLAPRITLKQQATKLLDYNKQAASSYSMLTPTGYKELDIDTLINSLDRTETALGNWGLKQLGHPLTDHKEIIQRQNIIKTLVVDTQLYTELTTHLQAFHQSETLLLDYWNPHSELHRSAKDLYFSFPWVSEYLNKSTLALETAYGADILKSLTKMTSQFFIAGFVQEKTIAESEKKPLEWINAAKSGISHPLRLHSPYPLVYASSKFDSTAPLYYMRLSGGDWYNVALGNAKFPLPNYAAIAAVCAGIGCYDAILGYSVYSEIENLKKINTIAIELQAELTEIANVLLMCKNIAALIADHQTLQQLPALSDINNFFKQQNQSPKLHKLIGLLESSTFTSKASVVFSRGKLLMAHSLLKQTKNEFIPLLQALAQVDAYVSIAKLYKEFEAQETRFCFPTFNQNTTPSVKLTGFWLPLMSAKKAVVNSITLGTDGFGNNAVFTGPNGGGKSTIMRSIAISIFLAQCWCIVPAQAADLSICTQLKTYLAPQESIAEGLSSFMAEKARIEELRTQMLNATASDRIFFIIDEPYRGTVEAEAAKRIYNFGTEIAAQPQCMAVFATHLQKPIQLASDTNGKFTNYHPEILETAQGLFSNTYKLLDGPALWWFEDEFKRSRLIDWLGTTKA